MVTKRFPHEGASGMGWGRGLPGVELFKFCPPHVSKAWALVRTHERPVLVVLDPLHEEVRYPKGIEEITCSLDVVMMCEGEGDRGG